MVAYMQQFITNCMTTSEGRLRDELTVEELDDAELCIVKEVQQVTFEEELRLIGAGKSLPKSNKLLGLCPYMDENGML